MPRRSHRAQRALPARAAPGRGRRRLHRPQTRPGRGEVRAPADGARGQRDLRGHRLPGTGHAPGERAGGIHARPGRRAPARDGQERRRQDAGAAIHVHRGLPRAGDFREKGVEDLRVHRVLRRVRVPQIALDDVRVARVPHGVSQGQLPAALHGSAPHDRVAELGQGGAVPGRSARARRAGPAARHQPERTGVRRAA